MPKALTLENLTIHCDACGHEFAGEIADWHNKPCPKCGAPNIVDDADVRQYEGLHGLVELVNALLGDVPAGHEASFRFNSAATKSPNAQAKAP